MNEQRDHSRLMPSVGDGTGQPVLDVLGPSIEFITGPDDGQGDLCVMRGVIPPGVTVPLHSHADVEDFLILSGSQQVLTQGVNGLQWHDARAGDYVHIHGGAFHAHRNVCDTPAVDLIITTAQLGRFFMEVGRPATDPPRPRTADDVARFIAVSDKFGYTLGTPEENAAVGIELPKFASHPT